MCMVVTRQNIAGIVQQELDRQADGQMRLIADLFIRRTDGTWVVRVRPDRDDVAAMALADRIVNAEDRLAESTGATIDLLPEIADDLGLLGAEVVKAGDEHGL